MIGAKTITSRSTTLGLAQHHDGVCDVIAKNPFYQVRGHLGETALKMPLDSWFGERYLILCLINW